MFYLFMLVLIGWYLIAELVYPSERTQESRKENLTYQGTFTWEKADGTKETIAVPGKYAVDKNETMVITTKLPETYTQTSFAIRSSLQYVAFYMENCA